MACSDWATGIEALRNFAFHDAVACKYTETAGTLFTGMMTFGVVNLALYIRTGGITMPVVLTLLVGGIVLPFLPGGAATIAALTLLFAIGVGPVLFLRRIGV